MFIGNVLPECGADLVTLSVVSMRVYIKEFISTYALAGLKMNLLGRRCQSAHEGSMYHHQVGIKTRQNEGQT